MAKDGPTGKPVSSTSGKRVSAFPGKPAPTEPAARHVYGPRTLASLLPPITRPAFKSRSPAATQIMTDWPELVGPEIAAVTAPRRFTGGTLTLAASGPTALEMQHRAPQLIERINIALGRRIVERLGFIQDDRPLGLPSRPPRAPEPLPLAIADLPDGPLHEALSRLGGRIVARTRR